MRLSLKGFFEGIKGFAEGNRSLLLVFFFSPFVYALILGLLGLQNSDFFESFTSLFFLLSLASFGLLFSILGSENKRRVITADCLLFVLFFIYWFFNFKAGGLILFPVFYGFAALVGGGWSFFKETFHHFRKLDFQSVLGVFFSSKENMDLGVFEAELNSFVDKKARTLQWKWVGRRGVFTLKLGEEVNRHMLIVGSSGFGKSNLLKNLAFRVSQSEKVHVIDSHGEYSNVVKGKIIKVGLVGLNLWDLDGQSVNWRISENVSVLKAVLSLGDVQAHYLTIAARKAYIRKGFKLDSDAVDVKFQAPSTQDVYDEAKRMSEDNSSVKTLLRRLEMLLWSNLFPSIDSIDLASLMNESVDFDLKGVPSLDLKVLFVEIYLRKVYNKAVSGQRSENLSIMIDEAESLLYNSTKAGEKFEGYADRLSSEARKFKVGLILSTQRCTALSKNVVNNCGIFFSFFLREPIEAKYISKLLCGNSSDEWKLSVVQEKLNILNKGECLCVSSVYRDTILIKTDFFNPPVLDNVVIEGVKAKPKNEAQKTLAEAEETEMIKPPEVKTGDLLKKELVKKASKEDLSKRQRRIMREIQHTGWVDVKGVMELNDVGERTAEYDLNDLISRNLIKKSGRARSTVYVLG